MGTSVRFTPLCGVSDEAPLCYLLEIDSFTILLDCGWDDYFDVSQLEHVKRVLPRVNAVLLSHPDVAHLGALPYLVGKCGLSAPIFSTKPVRRMGEMFLFEACVAKQAISDFETFDLDDVDAAFRLNPRWTELRYSQRHQLLAPRLGSPGSGPGSGSASAFGGASAALPGKGFGGAPGDSADGVEGAPAPGGGIFITPHPAGRFPGGAVWRISLGCGEEVVYAVDYNHRKERLLNETSFHELLAAQQPALLISDALNALAPNVDRRRRDEEFLDAIIATVEAEGSVLIPTDAAGRVLELALLLDEHFAKARTSATPVLLSATIKTVLEFARSQLEYFGSELVQAFSLKRTVPFSFRKLSVITQVEELGAFPGPKVVLATMPSLESGPARQLLVDWAAQPRNTIIFTERAHSGTLAHVLQNHVPTGGPEPLRLSLRVARRVPLEGEELAAWQAAQAAEAAAALQEGARRASGGADAPSALTSTPGGHHHHHHHHLTPASRLAAAARLASMGSLASATSLGVITPSVPAAAGGGGGGGGQGGSIRGGAPMDQQPLRTCTGSISKLVRDAATGAIVQQLAVGGSTPRAGGAATAAGRRDGGPRAGWDAGLLMDGFEPPSDAAFPMFPDDDDPLYCDWDEYGAVLGKDEFKVPMLVDAAGVAGPRAGAGGGGGDGMDVDGAEGGSTAGDADVADEVDEAPTKLVVSEVEVELRAALRFYDFEGRSDGRAIREYLGRVAPRRLALVHGSTAARAELAGAMRHDLAEYGTEVYTPVPGDVVEAHLAPSQMAALSESLAGALSVRQAGQYSVAWLEAVLAAGPAKEPLTGAPLLSLEPLLDDSDDSRGPMTAASAAAAAAAAAAAGAGVGSVLLAQAGSALTLSRLKAALAAAGFESHFPSRGVLAVMAGDGAGGTFIVTLGSAPGTAPTSLSSSSSDRAHVVLEGPASEAYFRVRDVIYAQFGVC